MELRYLNTNGPIDHESSQSFNEATISDIKVGLNKNNAEILDIQIDLKDDQKSTTDQVLTYVSMFQIFEREISQNKIQRAMYVFAVEKAISESVSMYANSKQLEEINIVKPSKVEINKAIYEIKKLN